MTTYEVQDATRRTVSTHRSEAAAIKSARKIADSRVMMHETSGTYKSTTCIYPAIGATYSN